MRYENHDKQAAYKHNNALQVVLSFNKLHLVKENIIIYIYYKFTVGEVDMDSSK